MTAVEKHRETSPTVSYTPPDLSHVLPYLYTYTETDEISIDGTLEEELDSRSRFFSQDKKRRSVNTSRQSVVNIYSRRGDRKTVFDLRKNYNEDDVREVSPACKVIEIH